MDPHLRLARAPSPPASHSISAVSPGEHHVLQHCAVAGFHGDKQVLKQRVYRQGSI